VLASTTEATPRKRAPKTRTPVPSIPLHEKIYLTTEETAVYIGGDVSPRTLERWRLEGIGPDFITVSAKMVRYRRATVDAWMLDRERKTRAKAAA
jgi:hypothetical protein